VYFSLLAASGFYGREKLSKTFASQAECAKLIGGEGNKLQV